MTDLSRSSEAVLELRVMAQTARFYAMAAEDQVTIDDLHEFALRLQLAAEQCRRETGR